MPIPDITKSDSSINVAAADIAVIRHRSDNSLLITGEASSSDHPETVLPGNLLNDIADLESLISNDSQGSVDANKNNLPDDLQQDIADLSHLLSELNANQPKNDVNLSHSKLNPLTQLINQAKAQPDGNTFAFELTCDTHLTQSPVSATGTLTFNFKNFAGVSANGAVFLDCSIAPYGNDDKFVVKLFSLDSSKEVAWNKANREYEISALTNLQAQAPVEIIINDTPYVALAMRQMPGVPLSSWLEKRPPLNEMLAVIAEIIKAYKKVHALGIMHLDIKPDNILIHYDEITGKWIANFIDYGFSTIRGKNFPINAGSTIYCAYEQFIRAQALDIDWITHNIDFPALAKMITGMLGGNYPLTNVKKYFQDVRAQADAGESVDSPRNNEKISGEEIFRHYDQLALYSKKSLQKALSQFPSEDVEAITTLILKFQSTNPQTRGSVRDLDQLSTYVTVLAGLTSLQQVEDDFQRAIDLAKTDPTKLVRPALEYLRENAIAELKQLVQPTPTTKWQDIKLSERNKQQVFDLINLAKNTRKTFEIVYEDIPNPTAEDGQRKMAAIAQYHAQIEKNTSLSLKTKESATFAVHAVFFSYTIACALPCVAAGFLLGGFVGAAIGLAIGCLPGLMSSGMIHARFFTSPADDMRGALKDKVAEIDFQTQASVMIAV